MLMVYLPGYPKGNAMRVKLARWGSSLAVHIPKDHAKTANWLDLVASERY